MLFYSSIQALQSFTDEFYIEENDKIISLVKSRASEIYQGVLDKAIFLSDAVLLQIATQFFSKYHSMIDPTIVLNSLPSLQQFMAARKEEMDITNLMESFSLLQIILTSVKFSKEQLEQINLLFSSQYELLLEDKHKREAFDEVILVLFGKAIQFQ